VIAMLNKPTDWASVNPMSALAKGQEQTEAMLGMQKELLDTYEQASRAWLARARSEVDLWTELATKLAANRSLPEALGTYQECVTQRMQMAAEDGRQMSEGCQKLLQTFTRPLPNGWPTGSGT
jgi:hypothetical protein